MLPLLSRGLSDTLDPLPAYPLSLVDGSATAFFVTGRFAAGGGGTDDLALPAAGPASFASPFIGVEPVAGLRAAF